MKKLVVATCAAALMTAVSFSPVSAQTTSPSSGQDASVKPNNPTDTQAKAKTKTKKKKKGAANESGATTGASTDTMGGAGGVNTNKQ